MGRRKQKPVQFVQGDSLLKEAALDSEEEPDGLHIGGAVIYSAPLSSRRPARLPTAGTAIRRGATAASAVPSHAAQELHELEQPLSSDQSLDDELRDYLDNIKRHNEEADEDSEQDGAASSQQQQQLGTPRPDGIAGPAGAAGAANLGSSWDDWNDSSGRPGLGFCSRSAAARFAGCRLEDALEGMLARDLGPAGTSDSDDSSSSSDDGGNGEPGASSSSSNSSSDDDGDGYGNRAEAPTLDLSSLDATTALVVDCHGQPMAVWEQLTLQQRFPVQTRQQQQQQQQQQQACQHGADKLRHSSGGRRGSNELQHRNSSGKGTNRQAAAGILVPPDVPTFAGDITTAAVHAAYSAAAAAADLEAVQRQQQRRQQKSLAKGAKRGQLLPGEKKKLRKEKIAAKRSVRRAERGQGALQLLAAVEEFALSGGDMVLLPPCGKHKQSFARAVAALYGVKASAQGGSSSGRTCLALTATASTAALDADAAGQLQALLAQELTQELLDVAIAAGPQEAAVQQDSRQSRQRSVRQRQVSKGPAATAAGSVPVFQQPVSFVSAGIVDPNSSRSNQAEQLQPASTRIEALGSCDNAAGDGGDKGQEVVRAGSSSGTSGRGSSAAAAAAVTHEATTPAVSNFLDSLMSDHNEDQRDAAAAAPADSAVLQQQQQQQQQEVFEDDVQRTAAQPAWVIDKEPWLSAQHTGLGYELGCAAEAAAAAEAPAGEAGATRIAAAEAAPLYDRVPVHLGLGCTSGGGSWRSVQQHGAAGSADVGMPETAQAAGVGEQQLPMQEQQTEIVAAAASSGKGGRHRLQELEDEFAALQAASNPAAARRQQRKQHRHQQLIQQQQQQQRLEARLAAPNTALGPAVGAAAVLGAAATPGFAGLGLSGDDDGMHIAGITLGLTAQQVKKAKKQQQRNQRREVRAAAAAAAEGGDEQAAAAATEVANVSAAFAGFEAHTRGIGSRLMAGWGWREGEGLGRARQGRPEPLAATRRARQLGLGAEAER